MFSKFSLATAVALVTATGVQAAEIYENCVKQSELVGASNGTGVQFSDQTKLVNSGSSDMSLFGFVFCEDNDERNGELIATRLTLRGKDGTKLSLEDAGPVGAGNCAGRSTSSRLTEATIYHSDTSVNGLRFKFGSTDFLMGTSSGNAFTQAFNKVQPLVGFHGRATEEGLISLGFLSLDTECEPAEEVPVDPEKPVVVVESEGVSAGTIWASVIVGLLVLGGIVGIYLACRRAANRKVYTGEPRNDTENNLKFQNTVEDDGEEKPTPQMEDDRKSGVVFSKQDSHATGNPNYLKKDDLTSMGE